MQNIFNVSASEIQKCGEIFSAFGFFGQLAHPGDEGGKLEQRGAAFDDPHVAEPDLLDELQLDELGHLVVVLADAKHVGDDVLGGVAHLPEVVHRLVGLVDVAADAAVEHVTDKQRMGLVANLKPRTIFVEDNLNGSD